MIVNRKNSEPGYIYVPYMMSQSIEEEDRNSCRKNRIRRIFGIPS